MLVPVLYSPDRHDKAIATQVWKLFKTQPNEASRLYQHQRD
jgi:hypothetical protein